MQFWDELINEAKKVRNSAYAPFSSYLVGAAIRGKSGKIYVGCNVENSSYGLTVCAERNAISAMIAAGETEWTHCAVVTKNSGSPCGACRQVLAEFTQDFENAQVMCCNEDGTDRKIWSIAELIPGVFRL